MNPDTTDLIFTLAALALAFIFPLGVLLAGQGGTK